MNKLVRWLLRLLLKPKLNDLIDRLEYAIDQVEAIGRDWDKRQDKIDWWLKKAKKREITVDKLVNEVSWQMAIWDKDLTERITEIVSNLSYVLYVLKGEKHGRNRQD